MILIVDDNQENIFSLKSLLQLHNFEVDTAMSGEEALKKVLKRSYALIILDVQMPEMDGFEVAEAISGYSRSKNIPIIFLSAVNVHKKFVTKGYESGGIDYLTKPFDPDILLLKVKTFYRLSEQTRELTALEKSLRQEIELRKKAEAILEQTVDDRTKALRRSNMQLEESNRELQQFAFIASHDLQEPLRKIETFSNMAMEKYIDEKDKVKNYLQKITNSAGRLRVLITDLLEYSRIYADDQFEPVDIKQLVKEVLSDLEVIITEKKCRVHISDLPMIEAIPSQLRQVFQNIIHNALKFSRADVVPEISIKGELIAQKNVDSFYFPEGKFCRIRISDNGIGFNDEFNHRIFEIFQRLNNRESYQGTGIGLAIVKKIIERHDGLITAKGSEGKGAIFTIVLPLKQSIHKPIH